MPDSPLEPGRTPDSISNRTLEIAHVLFTDIVGYSRLPMDEQEQLLMQLQDAVRQTPEFMRAEASEELIRLPTGDGMALVFFRDPEAPVRCAIELSRALRNYPQIKLRMGIHSGPVYRVADINANRNVAGGGINIAQRVMDCGDAGHVLVSEEMAKVLGQISGWRGYLQDLGEAEVKHSVRVHLFNLCTKDVGNSALPQKLRISVVKNTTNIPNRSDSKTHPAEEGSLRSWANRYRTVFFVLIAIIVLGIIGYRLLHYRFRDSAAPFQNFTITKLTDTGNLTNAAISPDGKYVVNVVQDSGMESLWLRNIPTNTDTQVVAPTQSHYGSVQFAPDGDYIYFLRQDNGQPFILYRSPVLSGNSQSIIEDNISTVGFSFSPDGQYISFFRFAVGDTKAGEMPEPHFNLDTKKLGSDDENILTKIPWNQLGASDPAWSPNGKVIVFSIFDKPQKMGSLIAIDPESGTRKTIVSAHMKFIELTWLPDGGGLLVLYSKDKTKTMRQQIGFISYPQGTFHEITRDTNNYLGLSVSLDGKTLTAVQREDSYRLNIMPSRQKDEKQVNAITPREGFYGFAWADEDNVILEDNSYRFYHMTDRGEKRTFLFEASPIFEASSIFQPLDGYLWTSCQGGRYIVFDAGDPGKEVNLRRFDTASTQIVSLTEGKFDLGPVCSLDGESVYYVALDSNSEKSSLQVKSIGGADSTEVSDVEIFPGFDVSPDKKLIAFWNAKAFGLIETKTGRVVKEFPLAPRLKGPSKLIFYPHFTPDSKAVAYIDHVKGVDNIWAQPLDGLSAYPITSFNSDEITDFHWSPSGDKLGLIRGRTESNVVLIRDVKP